MESVLNHQFSFGEITLTFIFAIVAALIVHPFIRPLTTLWHKIIDFGSLSTRQLRRWQLNRLRRKIKVIEGELLNPNRVIIRTISKSTQAVIFGLIAMFLMILSFQMLQAYFYSIIMKALKVGLDPIHADSRNDLFQRTHDE